MTEKTFRRYLELNRYQTISQQLYRYKVISRSDLMMVKKRIAAIEMDMITPKRKSVSHPRTITVNK